MKKLTKTLTTILFLSSIAVAQSGLLGSDGDEWSISAGILRFRNGFISRKMTYIPNYGQGTAPWYQYRESITNLIMDDPSCKITSIGNNAFYGLSKLTNVNGDIPSTVTSIGDGAFMGCASLKSITIPDAVTSIGSGAFNGCGLTSITIPDKLTSLGSAFENCVNLTSVTIGNSVSSISNANFYGCSRLTQINVSAYNSKLSSVNGVVFNKAKTEILVYPVGKHDAKHLPCSIDLLSHK